MKPEIAQILIKRRSKKRVAANPQAAQFKALMDISELLSPLPVENKQILITRFKANPDLATYEALQMVQKAIKSFLDSRILAKGDQGEQGIPGDRGLKGSDGQPGTNGKDGRNGQDGTDGRDGLPGRDAIYSINEVAKMLNTLTGVLDPKVLKPFEGKDIAKLLKELKGKDRISYDDIQPGKKLPMDQRWHGGGSSSGGSTPFEEVPAGVINDVNTVYVLSQVFSAIQLYKNGVYLSQLNGDYTLVGDTITLATPLLTMPVNDFLVAVCYA